MLHQNYVTTYYNHSFKCTNSAAEVHITGEN